MPYRALPKWLRHGLRISVRGLIVLVLIIGAGLGWIVNAARIQREAVASIQRDGGSVMYDWEFEGPWDFIGPISRSTGRPRAPIWLVDQLGVDYFGQAKSVALGQPGSPSALRNIGRLSHVERIDLQGPFVTDAGLAHLKGLSNLSYFKIGNRYGDCSGGTHLQDAARVTDAGMPYLKGLNKLSLLDLNGTKVSDTGMANLAGMTRLGNLGLADTRITDIGLVSLKPMTKLRSLDLSGTQISGAGLVHLKTLNHLTFLYLRGTQISDAGLEHLKNLTRLLILDLGNTRITDAGLEHLKGLPYLRDLDLRGTQVSLAGVRKLELALPREDVYVQFGREEPPVDRLEKTSPSEDAGP
jgi:internalin A